MASTDTDTGDFRNDPAHIVSIGSYGGECLCGKVFRCSTKFGADANRAHNLARANAYRHEEAAARRWRAAHPLT